MRQRIGPETASLLADFDARLFTDSEREAGALETWTGSVRRALPCDPALAAGLDFLAGFSVSAEEVEAPVHLLHGGQDPVCSLEAAVALSEALPRGSLRVVDGAGHAPHWTHPDEVHLWLRSAL
jgi:pimeloyl-ACP methyl ester carboxylesterase